MLKLQELWWGWITEEKHGEREKAKDKILGQIKGEERGRKEQSEVRDSARCL